MENPKLPDVLAAFEPHIAAWDAGKREMLKTDFPGGPKYAEVLAEQDDRLHKLREALSMWAFVLLVGKPVVKPPRVLRVRNQYGNDLATEVGGIFVVAEIFFVAGKWRHRVVNTSQFETTSYRALAMLGTDFYPDNDLSKAVLASSPWVDDLVRRRCSSVMSAVRAAAAEAKEAAPALASAYRERNSSADRAALVDKLSEPLKGNTLAKMDPESLAILIRSNPDEVEKVLRFMKTNKAVSGAATAEIMADAISASIVRDVMES